MYYQYWHNVFIQLIESAGENEGRTEESWSGQSGGWPSLFWRYYTNLRKWKNQQMPSPEPSASHCRVTIKFYIKYFSYSKSAFLASCSSRIFSFVSLFLWTQPKHWMNLKLPWHIGIFGMHDICHHHASCWRYFKLDFYAYSCR